MRARVFDVSLVDGHFHFDDVKAVLEAGQLRPNVSFVLAQKLQALDFISRALAYQGGEFGEMRERHTGFA